MMSCILHNADRLLPSQPGLSVGFSGDASEFYPSLERVLHSVLPKKSLEESFNIRGKDGLSYYALGSDLNRLRFYQFLVRLAGAKRILEIGTFIGVSTLFLAEATGRDGLVTSIEIGREFYALARDNIERNGMISRVDLVSGCALDFLTKMKRSGGTFDLILIDAAKQSYPELLDLSVRCLNPGGLVLVDDIFMQGETLNDAANTDKGAGVRKMLDDVAAKMWDFNSVILPIGNGLLLMRDRRIAS